MSIVWVGLDGDEIVAAHLAEYRKLRNVRRDPRVALSIEAGTHNAMGLAEYPVIHGQARVTEGGPPELLRQLADTYLGPDVRFPPRDDPPPGYITHITVERIGESAPGPREPKRRATAPSTVVGAQPWGGCFSSHGGGGPGPGG